MNIMYFKIFSMVLTIYKMERETDKHTRDNQELFSVMSGINRRVQQGSGYCLVLLMADRESVPIVLVTRLCESVSESAPGGAG